VQRPTLRPLSVGEVLDAAIGLYRRNLRTLVQVAAPVIFAFAVLELIVVLPALHSGQSIVSVTSGPGNSMAAVRISHAAVGAALVSAVLTLFAQELAVGASTKALADAYLGTPSTWQESLRAGAARVYSLVWVAILIAVTVTVGFFFFILPGIWLYGSFAVAIPVLMLEGRRGRHALGRSFHLVRHRWWATAAILLVGNLLVLLVSAIVAGVIDAALLAQTSNFVVRETVGELVRAAVLTFTLPFSASVALVLYVDLCVRKGELGTEIAERSGVSGWQTSAPSPPWPSGGPDPWSRSVGVDENGRSPFPGQPPVPR
jgi:hypothetical protein